MSSGVLSWLEIRQVTSFIYRDVDERINSQIQAVYSSASSAVFADSEELAYNVVEGLAKSQVILCAALKTPEKLYVSGEGCEGEPSYSRLLVSWWASAETIGTLKIYQDMTVPFQRVEEIVTLKILQTACYVVLITLALTFIVRKQITGRIQQLSKRISEINFNEDFELLSEGVSRDEIGNIARVINQLALYAQKHIIHEQIQGSKIERLSQQVNLVFEMSSSGILITDKNLQLKTYNPKFQTWLRSVCTDDKLLLNTTEWLSCFSDDAEAVKEKIISDHRYDRPSVIELKVTRDCNIQGTEEYYSLTYARGQIDQAEDEDIIAFYLRDLTEVKRRLKKTEYEASHDSLTELHNRLAATRYARHVFSSLDGDNTSALIFIDLDGFKAVNDTYGHDAGDELLRVISCRIKAQIRKTDIAARWGGDEFMVLLEEADANEAQHVAKKLQHEIIKPIFLEDEHMQSISVGASIGIAIADCHTRDFPTVLDYADQAMYEVKNNNKNGIRLYSHENYSSDGNSSSAEQSRMS